MKKLATGLLACAMAFELCACGRTVEEKWKEKNDEAVVFYEQMEEEKAIQAFTDALEIDPSRADSLIGRAKSYELRGASGDEELAKADYLKALKLDDHAEEVYAALAELYIDQGEMPEALQIFKKAADVLNSEEFQEKAEELNDWILEQTWRENYDLGMQHMLDGQYLQAAEAFTRAIEVSPEDTETYVSRANAYDQMNDSAYWEKAEADYLEALRLDPDQENVYISLSDLYLEHDNGEAAVQTLKDGAERLSSEILANMALAREANQYSDDQLLQIANENVDDVSDFEAYVKFGAVFQLDWQQEIIDEDEPYRRWFLVADERAQSMADIEAEWYARFSKKCPVPEEVYEVYKEIDGRLYSNNMGVGTDVTLVEMKLTTVESRDGTSVELSGYVLRQDWTDSTGGNRYKNELRYSMEFEDGKWKCSECEEVD